MSPRPVTKPRAKSERNALFGEPIVPVHRHTINLEGGPLEQFARLDTTDAQTFSGQLVIPGGTISAALVVADLNSTPIQSLIGAFLCTLGAEALTDARAWKLPDRVGSAGVTPIEARHRAVVTKTATYTLTDADDVILADATGGAITLNLPTAVGIAGRIYYAKKTDASANAVTLDGSGAQTIDGAATYALTVQYQSVTIVSNGSNWLIL